MTIKSDKWIKKMAESHGMITPFEPKKKGKKLFLMELQVMATILDVHLSLKSLPI
jgi:deoxycytidine triphosphate deaminase